MPFMICSSQNFFSHFVTCLFILTARYFVRQQFFKNFYDVQFFSFPFMDHKWTW